MYDKIGQKLIFRHDYFNMTVLAHCHSNNQESKFSVGSMPSQSTLITSRICLDKTNARDKTYALSFLIQITISFANVIINIIKTVALKLLSLQPYGSSDFEVGSCRQHGFFISLQWGMLLYAALLIFK